MHSFSRLIIFTFLLLSLTGCYNKPVRHLASDVVLIQTGTSTREDVIMYLGEPDDIQVAEPGVERWVYSDTRRNIQEGLPWVGKYFGEAERTTVAVTIKNNVVVDSRFVCKDADDLAWQKDFDWQEKGQENQAPSVVEEHSPQDSTVQ